jgi:thiamine-monophosphate kinase
MIPLDEPMSDGPLSRTVPLGTGGEFDCIRRFLSPARPLHAAVTMGAGDDASVLEDGWVLSTDLTVEDVHFRRTWVSDEEIGGRAVLAALSDLAAMAARPVAVLASVAFPRGGRVDVDAVMAGVRQTSEAWGASLIGGDLSRSPGPLVLDVVVVGRAESPCYRSGSQAGDQIWVTGTLGGSAATVRIWEAGEEPPAALREAYIRPSPRITEALDLASGGLLHGMLDLSDGLAGDVGHLAAAGDLRAILEVERVPVSEAARGLLGDEVALDLALHGGEDYELCFTAAPGSVDPAAWTAATGVRITRVGRMEEGDGVYLQMPDGELRGADRGGFDHFGSQAG